MSEKRDWIKELEEMTGTKLSFWQKVYLRWLMRNSVKRSVKTIKEEIKKHDSIRN